MRPKLPANLTAFCTRRTLSCAMLLVYVFTSGGLPLPVLLVKDQSQPFPCQTRRCGCASAEQCAQRCCCFSAEEKQAWFASHSTASPWPSVRKTTSGCCEKSLDGRTVSQQSTSTVWIDPNDARHCGGELGVWVGTCDAVLPEQPFPRIVTKFPVEFIFDNNDAIPRSLGASPPVPPPQS